MGKFPRRSFAPKGTPFCIRPATGRSLYSFLSHDLPVCLISPGRCALTLRRSLDRLLLLLDTGSSLSVRNTAAKQLAQLAARSLISDVAVEDDFKSSRQHASTRDTSACSELLAVVARVSLPHLYSSAARHSPSIVDITLSTFKESRNQIRGIQCPLTNIRARSCLVSSIR